MSKVHATESVVVTLPNGITLTVRKDQGFDQSDDVVKAFPWLFGLRTNRRGKVVEQATAAPGELRDL